MPPLAALPNVITPNGDGLNDAFAVETPGPWSLVVYNRWGREVWRSPAAGYASDWEAVGLSAGVYYYYLTHADGRRYRGALTVVR